MMKVYEAPSNDPGAHVLVATAESWQRLTNHTELRPLRAKLMRATGGLEAGEVVRIALTADEARSVLTVARGM